MNGFWIEYFVQHNFCWGDVKESKFSTDSIWHTRKSVGFYLRMLRIKKWLSGQATNSWLTIDHFEHRLTIDQLTDCMFAFSISYKKTNELAYSKKRCRKLQSFLPYFQKKKDSISLTPRRQRFNKLKNLIDFWEVYIHFKLDSRGSMLAIIKLW